MVNRNNGDATSIGTATSHTFDALILRGQGPIAVEFMSYGCANCRAIEPVLEEAAEILKGKEQVFRVNVAIDPELPNTYEIAGTPTFVMFLDGQEVGRAEGPHPNSASVMSAITQPFAP